MKTLKFILLVLLTFASNVAAFAHVGSPGVIYQGKAGPYTIMVNINPPDVIPGTANISVYIDNQQVSHVYAQPVYWYAGDKGSPRADEALPVSGTPGQYQASVWLMQRGVASMRISVEGIMGKGSAIIPVMAASTATRTMPKSLDWELAGLGLLLVVLMITIIGASVTDGTLPPGIARMPARKKYIGMAVAGLILFLILYGGSAWWNSWSSNYRRFLYKAPLAHSSIIKHGLQNVLQLSIDTGWLRKNNQLISYIVPDHGKLMHLFLIREKTDDVFAHLHPLRKDSVTYLSVLPDLPAGRYLLFGDIVRWSGLAETISDTLNIPEKPIVQNASDNSQPLYIDPDDTYVISNPINDTKNAFTGKEAIVCGKPGTAMNLADGSTATWQHVSGTPFEANKIYPLTFMINDPTGQPAKLQPYMGMKGHAVIFKYDGSVYVHLHPVGTYSMASQQIIQNRIRQGQSTPVLPYAGHFVDSIDNLVTKIRAMSEDERNTYLNANMKGMDMTAMNMKDDGMVTFPYAFPSPGKYRIWIQMKRDGKILNSAFDAVVE